MTLLSISCRIDNNVITVVGFQGTSIVVLPEDGAQAPKRIGDIHQLYVYNDTLHVVGIKKVSDVIQNVLKRKA